VGHKKCFTCFYTFLLLQHAGYISGTFEAGFYFRDETEIGQNFWLIFNYLFEYLEDSKTLEMFKQEQNEDIDWLQFKSDEIQPLLIEYIERGR
jgi:hypothetical protein